jgi:hypothetical protein
VRRKSARVSCFFFFSRFVSVPVPSLANAVLYQGATDKEETRKEEEEKNGAPIYTHLLFLRFLRLSGFILAGSICMAYLSSSCRETARKTTKQTGRGKEPLKFFVKSL